VNGDGVVNQSPAYDILQGFWLYVHVCVLSMLPMQRRSGALCPITLDRGKRNACVSDVTSRSRQIVVFVWRPVDGTGSFARPISRIGALRLWLEASSRQASAGSDWPPNVRT
jgi:hypothetical protein